MGDTYRNRSKANIRELLLPPLNSLRSLNGFFTEGEKPAPSVSSPKVISRLERDESSSLFTFVESQRLSSKVKREDISSSLIRFYVFAKSERKGNDNYSVSIVSNSNLISFQTSQAAANSGLHLQAARITSPPSRAKSRPSFRA